MYPALQVVAVERKGALAVPVGGHVSLAGRGELVLGRDAQADVPLRAPSVSARHCVLRRQGDGWALFDPHVWGTYVNGRRVLGSVGLQHGDHVELKGAVVFRFLEHEAPEPRSEELERRIAQAPDDEVAWRVYGDWLTERGADVTERLQAGAGGADEAKWLGPLARFFLEGEVEVQWTFGFVRRAVVRRLLEPLVPPPPEVVRLLVEAPACRLLQELEVDLSIEPVHHRTGADRDGAVSRVLLALAASAGAPWLTRVTVGPAPTFAPGPRVRAALEKLRRARPRLALDERTLVRRAAGAELELVQAPKHLVVHKGERTERFPLKQKGASLVGPLANADVEVRPRTRREAWKEGFAVWQDGEVWTVTPPPEWTFLGCKTLKVNGRERRSQCLRSGDTIELVPDLVFRFHTLAA